MSQNGTKREKGATTMLEEAGISSNIRKNCRQNGLDPKNCLAVPQPSGKVYEVFNPTQQ
jgi:hypothetical protein